MKEKVKPGRFAKGVLVVLQQALVILCTVSITLFGLNAVSPAILPYTLTTDGLERHYYYGDYDSFFSAFHPEEDFEDTRNFSNMMRNTISDVIRYCVIREQMESDAVFDGKKVIDIKQYANHINELLPTEETSVCYYLEDLISWSQYGWDMKEVFPGTYTYVKTSGDVPSYWYRDDGQKVIISNAAAESNIAVMEYDVEYIEEEADDNAIYGPVERYLPIDEVPLEVRCATLGEYQEYTAYLSTTIDMIEINYAQYQGYQKYFDEQNLSMKYYITVGEGSGQRVYTNLEGPVDGSFRDIFTSMGEYLYYAPTSSQFESSIDYIGADEIRNIWQKYTYAFSEPCTIWIGVDTSYPYNDNFSTLAAGYRECMAENQVFAVTAVFAVCAAGILWIVLTVFAGRKKESETVALLRFDRLCTEAWLLLTAAAAAAAFLSFVGIVNAMNGISLSYDTSLEVARRRTMLTEQKAFVAVIVGVWTFTVNSMAVFLYLSFVRRLKAHTILSNSLFVRICRKIRRAAVSIYRNADLSVRTVLPVLGAGLINLFMGVFLRMLWTRRLHLSALFLFLILLSGNVLVGILLFREAAKRQNIVDGIGRIKDGDLSYKVDTTGLYGQNLKLATAVNSIGEGIQKAVENSMKDERMKADLITNVSHDIKTPLTSIINYVDLLKRENIQDDTIKGYIGVLDMKSQRLKQLTEDLVEASKISSGNITLDMKALNLVELLQQTAGEYEEKFQDKDISLIMNLTEHPVRIQADSRRMWRIIENLYSNICKYALAGTRAYVDIMQTENEGEGEKRAVITIKNISEQPLNIAADELTERFIRGDVSRSSEGSGLGLSIAKSLVEAQKGTFTIYLDGDLFKVTMVFPVIDSRGGE